MQTLFASILRKKKTKKRVQPKQSHSFFLANWFGSDIAIDLGTANIIVFVKNRGIVVNEPAVIAVDTMENKVVAIGREAQAMLGRTPRNIHAYHPLRNGVIADYDATEYMLRYFIRKAIGKALIFKRRTAGRHRSGHAGRCPQDDGHGRTAGCRYRRRSGHCHV